MTADRQVTKQRRHRSFSCCSIVRSDSQTRLGNSVSEDLSSPSDLRRAIWITPGFSPTLLGLVFAPFGGRLQCLAAPLPWRATSNLRREGLSRTITNVAQRFGSSPHTHPFPVRAPNRNSYSVAIIKVPVLQLRSPLGLHILRHWHRQRKR